MDLKGRGVLVTGASRGLGAALSRELARAAARVVMVARNEAALEEAAAKIRASGGEAHAIAADIGDKRSIHRIAGAAAALVGDIDVVIHNASTLGVVPLRPLVDTDCESLEDALSANLVGPFRLTKALLPAMLLRRRGLVVQITSDASVNAYPNWGAYGVSKAALDHLGRIFGAELEGSGVRVVTIDPGEMDTQMHADAIPDADRAALAAPDDVAKRIVAIVRASESLANGARVEARS
jgi:NAD(P)-dependent dehydrogenase (short-subunit alcohol dehydrogenase family)